MEDLNKTQIVLLSLLVSFVTSIATGIITTSLLSEAPPVVTQTINRVVQQTIEKVSPAGDKVKEVTVVVKEEDLVIDAIDKNEKSVVRIKEALAAGLPETFFDIGLVVSKDGLIVTDKKTFNELNKYSAIFSDGKVYSLVPVAPNDTGNLLFFRVTKDDKDTYVFDPTEFMAGSLKLGQTVIAISGEERNSVSIGRVSDLVTTTDTAEPSATTTGAVTLIKTDMIPKDTIVGAPLVNLSGEVVGIRISASDVTSNVFLPVQIIKQEIAKLSKQP